MSMRRALVLALFGCVARTAVVNAQDFQLIVAQLPPGGGSQQPILRFNVAGTGGAMTPLSDIPASLTFDPAGIAFRTPQELFVGDRHGNNGQGSVSRFTFDGLFANFAQQPIITGNSLSNCHQVAFDPVSGELFVRNRDGGVPRFVFDALGHAIPNGVVPTPASGVGVALRSDGQRLFVANYDGSILRFQRAGGGFTPLPSIFLPGGSGLHYIKFRGAELYGCSLYEGLVRRIAFDASDIPFEKPPVPSPGPIDVAFSPDGNEMFAASHFGSGITRYQYDANSDSWTMTANISTPTLGGVATTHAAVQTNCGLIGDMNIDGLRDGDDIPGFVNCVLGINGTNCPCADTDANGVVNADDQPGFVEILLGL